MSGDSIEKAVNVLTALDSSKTEETTVDAGYSPESLDTVETKPTASEDFAYSKSTKVAVSDEHLRKNRVLTPSMDKTTVNAYKILRTRVLRRMEQNSWSTLAITSPKPDEGKTLTAINLSISLAHKLDYTVLLVDLDFKKPTIHKYFGFEPERGVSDYLEGQISLEEAFVSPGIKRLLLLPAGGGMAGNTSEMLSSSKMERLVAELKSRYASRILIFDLPPVLVGDDVLAFSNIADAFLLLAREGKTTTDELQRTVELLETKNLLGTVLNHSSVVDQTSNYGY
jgi:capsular exopolysaccharide synthesis family protein